MLVDLHTKRLEVPGEPDEWIEVRRLSFGERRELMEASHNAYLNGLSGLAPDVLEAYLRVELEVADARKALREAADAKAAETGEAVPAALGAEEKPADPLTGMDIPTVLRYGIVAWSYVYESGDPVPVGGETVAMLDEHTAKHVAREILLLGEDHRLPLGSSPASTASSPGQ